MKLEIVHDMYPQDPRKSWDNLSVMVCKHGRYSLGDEDESKRHDWRDYTSWAEFGEAIRERVRSHGDRVVAMLPLYLYDHSGITMRTTPFACRWDSGQVGFIYVTAKKLLESHHWKHMTAKRRAWAEELLVGEVKIYDLYLRGEVYGFIITHDDGEEADACWGFYGETEAREAGKEALSGFPAQLELTV
jgi:hypothetical protein